MTVFTLPVIPVRDLYDGKKRILNEQELELYSKLLINKEKTLSGMSNGKWDMQAGVNGIFFKHNALFFQLSLKNTSVINYTPEFIRFYIRDKKKSKRTASQEVELKPIYTYGDASNIEGNRGKNLVFAFEKFTIPESKYLYIEIMEKSGGRNLTLRVKNKKLIKATLLPETK